MSSFDATPAAPSTLPGARNLAPLQCQERSAAWEQRVAAAEAKAEKEAA
eukprot:CAMPEP_0185411086 /NCGR_PEP_ID=MMETSP1365-20130426/3399_1 /TAXON_ID=38817 /ORGANISM="Gephyrocapsa oceanica, Strain RCC1303" /LENGTH=48 /DNA_ID= /DNA_START= /DNA_END= /DNA_ORIENTATION=